MQCPSCSAGNPDGMRYCGHCASPLPLCCPACGFVNPVGFSFCGQCGGALPAAPETGTVPALGEEPDAERRPLTVLFCDLVGSTALSERLDPEELMSLLRRYQRACTEVVDRFEGHIAQYLGDGLLVYFGYPRAHEDDAARAVRTALGIFEAMARLNREVGTAPGEGWAVRIGVHTGTVVVGEMGSGPRRERLALGQSPNVAARLQSLAEPGTVLTSGATYQLVARVFDGEPLGRHRLKGISEPVEVVRILGERTAAGRPQARGLAPLVGRREELGTLLDRWRAARGGAAQIVLLEGEAGMGKTRLVDSLFEALAVESHRRCEGFCSPYYRNTALYPVIDLLQRELGLEAEEAEEGEEGRLERLEGALGEAGFPVADSLPLWAGLLGISVEGRHQPSLLSPQRQRQVLLEGLVGWLLRQAVERPLLLVVHDTHWIDPTTVELLSALAGRLAEVPVLLLLTYRPGFSCPFPDSSHLTHLTLASLERQEVLALVRSLTDDQKLVPEILDRLVERSDGVPLYVEEMTRSLLESDLMRQGATGDSGVYSLAIPATLESSLMARLDRLGAARETAQVASVLGRSFELELLREIWPRDPAALDHSLQRLHEAQLVHREATRRATYVFRHALIQEAAYESLLLVERRRYHGRAAEALQRRFGALGGPRPELLAHHFTAAGRAVEAISYWQRAGQDALERSANVEAARHLESGIELVPRLPDPSRRPAVELELQTLLGPALMASQGYASPAVASVYHRARELAEEGGTAAQRIRVFLGLARFHGARAELARASEVGRQLLEISQQAGDAEHVLEAHRYLGAITFHQGALVEARRHLDAAVALFDPEAHRSHTYLYNEDTEVFCSDYLAWTLWHLGHPDQALEHSRRARTRARSLAHPFTEAHVLGFLAVLHQYRLEPVAARARAEELCALSEKHGFPHRLAMGLSVRGWALAEEGRLAEGIEEMERGLHTWRATGAKILVPQLLAYLADALRRHGDGERCLQLLDEAQALTATTQERFFDPELLRLRGLALRDRGDAAAAVAGFEHGLETARELGARSLALRCATTLAEAWRRQGRGREARRLLEELTAPFEEGLETADLAAARDLLKAGA